MLDEEGRVLAVVERTNNIDEHLFGRGKQLLRRRVGRAHLARDLEQQPPQAALVDNLRSPQYVRIVCGSFENLPTAFARLDLAPVPATASLRPEHPNGRLQRFVRQLLADSQASPDSQHDSVLRLVRADLIDVDPGALEPSSALPECSLEHDRPATPAPAHKPSPGKDSKPRDPRLPPPGSVLERWRNGRAHRVFVGDRHLVWRDNTYDALTPIARQLIDSDVNGFVFFGLTVAWNKRAARMRGRRISRTTLIDLPAATES